MMRWLAPVCILFMGTAAGARAHKYFEHSFHFVADLQRVAACRAQAGPACAARCGSWRGGSRLRWLSSGAGRCELGAPLIPARMRSWPPAGPTLHPTSMSERNIKTSGPWAFK